MHIVLMGRPGSGKGTQANFLHNLLGIPIVSVGDTFRDHIARGSRLGQAARQASLRGGLVDDSLTSDLVRDALGQIDPSEGFLLDGYPRTVVQAVALDGILRDFGSPLHLAIEIAVREEVAFERVSRRSNPHQDVLGRFEAPPRIDDAGQKVRARMQVFAHHMPSLRTFYRDRGMLCSVDGSRSALSVSQTLEDAIRIHQAPACPRRPSTPSDFDCGRGAPEHHDDAIPFDPPT